ncbi:MAG: type II secretion system F family protein [Acidobacteriota bacterium]|nr:type II secretion system F family protein [Acidobacteriota bacterium]
MGILLVIFTITFLVVVGCVGLCLHYFKRKQKHQIRSMLRNAEATPAEQRETKLMRPAEIENLFSRFLRRFEVTAKLKATLEQAGSEWSVSKLFTMSVLAALIGLFVGLKIHLVLSPSVIGIILAIVGGCLPFLLILRKRSKTFRAFEEQFPEALDFLSRSMRAGHGFSIALDMLASDSPDPLGRAFRRVSNDLALGSSMEIALGKLIALIPLVDVQFFVSSVVLQQETGGNLGEILTKLSYIIRERFRLKGQVRAVSAHGRITGLVLLLMPLAVTGFMMVTNPGYIMSLTKSPIGRDMIYGAIGGQVLGYFVIKKITNIKV